MFSKNKEILENYVREWHETDVAEAIKELLNDYETITLEKVKPNEINIYIV